jgi:hypothetical protein
VTVADRAHNRRQAEAEHIAATLRTYGVLTRARLVDLCGAGHWSPAAFAQALELAVSSGRVRRLGNELYETSENDQSKER